MKLSELTFDLNYEGRDIRNADVAFLAAADVPEDVILSAVKQRLKAVIDVRAEALRSAVTTPGAGQAMEYQEAFAQAAAADKAKSGVTPENYPMLAATIGIDIDPTTGQLATDVAGVARSILMAREAWVAFGSEIRRVRLAAKQAISEAGTLEDACAAVDAVVWPSSQ